MNKRFQTLKSALASLGYYKLYHGTTADRADQILAGGFDLTKGGEKSGFPLPGISFSIDEEVATDHAKWASKKFNSPPAVIVINNSNLSLASGTYFNKLLDKVGSYEEAINLIRSDMRFDGVELWDDEDGIEEYEVLVFNVDKIQIVGIETQSFDFEDEEE